ncbi:hypothetical protein ACTFIR_012879 [Dictyostelium discoideum]
MIIRFKINEIECEVNEEKEDITILQACTANGIEIPRFCYHEKLTIAGNCRMCLVYVTNEEKLLAACGIPLDENFDDESIETEIDEILKAREGVMEFLLINHPLDCPICDQGGECDLQEQTLAYGLDTGRFYIKKRAVEIKTFGRLIKGIMTRCIHCTRCVRFLTEIAGVNELGVLGRGYNMEIGTYKKNVMIESELSGNIIDLCPVGALTSAVYAYKGRPWELKNIKGIDIFDTLLTPINYQVKGGEIFRILPRINDRINEEWITDKVRFHYESYKIIDKIRKETPSYKIQANKFIELSWKTALKMVFKVLLNKKNKVDLIIGSKINSTNLRIYKELMNRLGSKNYITENGLMFKKFNYDLRENYINSNDLYNVDKNDLVLLCGINLRVESPLLNIKLRNVNFGDDEIESVKKIGIIGNKFDWKHESEYIGATVNIGPSLLTRISLTLQELRAIFMKACNLKPENILIITQGANFGMALEEGLFKENFSIGGNVLYSIDSNEVQVTNKINYVIYQGIINDKFENKIDLYLPSKHYFEDFEGDREVYMNTFGQRSEIEKLRISKGNKIKENSMIGYIQLMYLNNKEMTRKEKEQKEIKISYREMKKEEKRKIKVNKYLTINNIIENYYMTDINIRLINLILPLIGSIITGIFGHKLGNRISIQIAVGCMMLTAISSLYIGYEILLCNSVVHFKLGTWMQVGSLNVEYGLLYDSLTSIMIIVITCISSMVHLYSMDYMKEDPHKTRFFSYLSLFTFFMMLLVTADNFVQLFFGWEGVGIMSYLLINFWYTRLQANKSALKAVILNRFGDFGLFFGILLVFLVFKSVDFSVIFTVAPFITEYTINLLGYEVNAITLIGSFIVIGVVGKSAQLGLHMWLPDAMEGPTPVSALLHAATMVTAGVFLVLRTSPLLSYSITILNILTIIGALTTLFATTIGIVQNDIKRVIAYSTCSQLGYMIFACGLLNYNASIYHLTTHAFFKALLFLSAGSVIHGLNDEQDMRKMGGLVNLMPLTYQCMLIGTLALTGFPFLSGYYSKDIILETSYATYYWEGTFAAIIGYVAAFGTTFYSFRLLILTFFNKPRMQYKTIAGVHEASTNMVIPLVILALCSIFIGYVTKDLFVGLGTPVWNNSFFAYPYNNLILESEVLQRELKLLPLFAFIYGVITPVLFYFNIKEDRMLNVKQNLMVKESYFFFVKKWYFDFLSRVLIVVPFFHLSYDVMNKNLDKGLWEKIGVTGVATTLVTEFTALKLKNEITLSTYISYIVQTIILIIVVGIFSFMTGFIYIELCIIIGILYICLPSITID